MLSFAIIQLPPGDYVDAYIAQLSATGSAVSKQEADNLRIQYGLDQPIYVQYLKWLGLASRGNFGMAMEGGRPVTEVIGDRLALTMVVSIVAVLFPRAPAPPIGGSGERRVGEEGRSWWSPDPYTKNTESSSDDE